MATTVNFALTDDNGQLTGKPLAHVQGLADSAASAVEAKIPDVSGFALKTAIPDTSTLATKTEVSTLSDAVEAKADVATVDSKVSAAKTDLTSTFDSKIAASEQKILASVGTGTTSATATRLVPLALTLGQDDYTIDLAKRPATSNRIPLKFSTSVPKWRIHLRNANPRTGRVFTGAVPIDGIWIGVHDRSSVTYTLNPNKNTGGKYLGAPTKIVEAFTTPTDGSEWVSDWFTTEIGDGTERLLEIAYSNVPSGTSITRQLGGSYYVGAGHAGDATYAGGWVEGDTPFDIWIEAEVPASTPVLAVYGDSLSSGVRAERPVADSPLSLYTFTHNALPVHYSASGDTMTSWNTVGDAGWKVNRWDNLSKADGLLFSMGSNDVFANVTLSGMKSRFADSLTLMSKRIKDGAPVYLSTILPRTNKTDSATVTSEAVRREYNSWLKAQEGVGSIKDVIDIVPAVSDDDETLKTAYDADGVHLYTPGYKAIADALNLPPMPAPVAAGAVSIVDNGNGTATITL